MERAKQKGMVVAVFLAFFLGGCTLAELVQEQFTTFDSVVGTWKLKNNAGGSAKLTFLSGGDYEFDIDGDGAIDVGGRYEVLFNKQIKLQDEEGEISADCREPGIYKYKINNRGLKFYLLGDQCFARSDLFRETWVRVKHN